MTVPTTRRRFLQIVAATAALPGEALAEVPATRWRGTALGAGASMTLRGVEEGRGRRLIGRALAELARLEGIFSLHRTDSAISRLNRDGRLDAPPSEMVELLGLCRAVHDATGGVFDPTVQPLWRLVAERAALGGVPTREELAAARALIGWRHVGFDPQAVRFDRPGMALTLNGIAQGFITDRIAALLRGEGLGDLLIDMGEIVALGSRDSGGPWRAGIAEPSGRIVTRVGLADTGLATSAPFGTVLDDAGTVGHILDPTGQGRVARWSVVSVLAPRAAVADGLSTALCLMTLPEAEQAVARFPDARIEAMS